MISQPQESKLAAPSDSPTWQIKLLYDGECPLCLREVRFLRQRDAGKGRVAFVDIADPNYDPAAHGGIDFATAMGRIHAILSDGTVVKDLEVFRQVYQVIGLGWVYAAVRWPVIGPLLNWLYGIWANLRLPLTGRADLATLIAQRQQAQNCDASKRCHLEP
jgi:predicted DCC family thiol-disulfide oxidoreductase YuxK